MAKNHEIRVYFSTNAILTLSYNFEIHNAPVSKLTKDAIELESCKQIKI